MTIEAICVSCNGLYLVEPGDKSELCGTCIIAHKRERREERNLLRSQSSEEKDS